jgi:hypothetical protein
VTPWNHEALSQLLNKTYHSTGTWVIISLQLTLLVEPLWLSQFSAGLRAGRSGF